jgi:monothiol glutaredoxin
VDIIDTIKEQIANNTILLYMKGSPNAPQCGFSSRAAQVVMACGEKFAYVDILQNPEIRANLPKYANWPTFPQLWVAGELVGGSDIMTEMFEKGELQTPPRRPRPNKPSRSPEADATASAFLCPRIQG